MFDESVSVIALRVVQCAQRAVLTIAAVGITVLQKSFFSSSSPSLSSSLFVFRLSSQTWLRHRFMFEKCSELSSLSLCGSVTECSDPVTDFFSGFCFYQ